MCKLWITEPSRSWEPCYFIIEELDSSLDTVGEGLADLGYKSPPTFSSAVTEAYQLSKESNVLLLHEYGIEDSRRIVGLSTPVIANTSEARRDGMLLRILGIIFIIFLGIVIGIALAGLGVRGEVRPYLLDWLFENRIVLSGIGIILFIMPSMFCYRFFKLNILSRNYEAAVNAHADLTAVLDPLCASLQTETFTVVKDPKNPEDKGVDAFPEFIRETLERLVSVVDGLTKIEGSILDINIKPVRPDITRTY